MKYVCFALGMLAAGAASADPGHLGQVAGHDHGHWLAAAALAAAIAVGIWAGLKGHKNAAQTDAEYTSDEETQGA